MYNFFQLWTLLLWRKKGVSYIAIIILLCIILSSLSSFSFATSLNEQLFDFHYSGDVAAITKILLQYDTSLKILPPLGTRKALTVNLDLAGVTITEIADNINQQTDKQVNLLYNLNSNTIRLSYTGAFDTANNALHESLKWQRGTTPRPLLHPDGVVRFPYGAYQPVITCQPLNLCDIELQEGEKIKSVLIGDAIRWNDADGGVPIVYSGTDDNLTPHLVVKPDQSGLNTSLMITTSKRTYMLKLKSANNNYIARAGFYYPNELTAQMITSREDSRRDMANTAINAADSTTSASNTNSAATTSHNLEMPLINLSKINNDYTISGEDYYWRPTQVFDDGISVYVQLPNNVSSRDLPGVCVFLDGDNSGKQCSLVNFRYKDHFYIIDKLFKKAKLINGYSNSIQTITISKNNDNKGFWHRLFGGK